MALFLTLLDRFKNHIFYERKRMKKLALFLTDVKKLNYCRRNVSNWQNISKWLSTQLALKIQIYVGSMAIYSNFRVFWFTFKLSKKRQGQEHFNERLICDFLFLDIR
jgi:hypothetical protein